MTDVALPEATHVLIVPEKVGDEWQYPTAWSEDQRERFEAAVGEEIAHEKAADAAQKRAADLLASPEMLIEIQVGKAAEMKRAAERAKRGAEGEIHWLKARAKYGDDVRRVDVEPDGDVIILRRMDSKTIEAMAKRDSEIMAEFRATVPVNATQAQADAIEIKALGSVLDSWQAALIANAAVAGLDADASAKRIRELIAKYAMLWRELARNRDAMICGFRVAEGKGSAPS